MTLASAFTLFLFAATLVLLGTQRLRGDLVALLVMLVLALSGILTPTEVFAAFGQPVLIVVASIFVLGAAMTDTGVALIIAAGLMRFARRGPLVLGLILILTAGLMSGVLSALVVVSVLMPAVLRMARRIGLSPAVLLLPLATATTLGNQFTLIGTPSNLVVNDLLRSSGERPVGFFELAPYAALALAAAMLWFAVAGRKLLFREVEESTQRPSFKEVEESYGLPARLYRLRVRTASPLVGEPLFGSGLRRNYRLSVMAIQRDDGKQSVATPDTVLEVDDLLIVEGHRGDVLQAASRLELEPRGEVSLEEIAATDRESLRLAEVIVPFRSELVGKSLAEAHFQEQHGLTVVAIQRQGEVMRGPLAQWQLEAGDTLLVEGPKGRVQQVGRDWNLLPVVELGPQPGEEITQKAGLTVAILAAMVLVVALDLLPLAVASLAAALALVLSGCITMPRALQSIDGPLLLLIGGLFPLAEALQRTGTAALIARLIAAASPLVGAAGVLVLLYAITCLITQIVSNSVTAALMTPIAIQLAHTQGVPPHVLAIAVIFAVNTAYLTPLTDGNNLLVREPGGYTMRDYLVHGGPIFLLQSAILLLMLVPQL